MFWSDKTMVRFEKVNGVYRFEKTQAAKRIQSSSGIEIKESR